MNSQAPASLETFGQLGAVLTEELRSELPEVALWLDRARTLGVIDKIAERDASVAALEVFVENLDFDGLLGLLEDTASKPEEGA